MEFVQQYQNVLILCLYNLKIKRLRYLTNQQSHQLWFFYAIKSLKGISYYLSKIFWNLNYFIYLSINLVKKKNYERYNTRSTILFINNCMIIISELVKKIFYLIYSDVKNHGCSVSKCLNFMSTEMYLKMIFVF